MEPLLQTLCGWVERLRLILVEVGVFVFGCALALPLGSPPASVGRPLVAALAVLPSAGALPGLVSDLVPDRGELWGLVFGAALQATSTELHLSAEALGAAVAELPWSLSGRQEGVVAGFVAEPKAAAAAPPEPAPAAPVALFVLPELPPPAISGVVTASWYGPGFYGNRTACGQTYTPEIEGVAHRTLPCGTRVAITSPAGRTVVVAVIDRGPYVAGRALDLSSATKTALLCSDLCTVRMQLAD